jgi:NAD(P)-dependent dehydrogenase (short-subunit alcohol dehydrogenase family)
MSTISTTPSTRSLPGQLPELVVVTGTGGGLGAVLAEKLLAAGCGVIGVDLAAAPPVLAGYDGYTHVAGSVTDEQLWAGVTASLPGGGSLGLVTNAAILHVGDILTQPMDQVRQTLDVNIVGTVMAMRAVIPAMVARGGGSVVSVASIDAHFAEQQLAAYCASKSAVLQLARTVALDQARAGVNVNVVCPGPMRAGLFERHLASADDSDAFLHTREQRQPFGEILDPAQVADGILFLLSDAARGMTGASVMIDGGLTTGFDFRTGAEGTSVRVPAASGRS